MGFLALYAYAPRGREEREKRVRSGVFGCRCARLGKGFWGEQAVSIGTLCYGPPRKEAYAMRLFEGGDLAWGLGEWEEDGMNSS